MAPHASLYVGGLLFFGVYLLFEHGYDYTGHSYDNPYIAPEKELRSKRV